jgi:hypothetical protein
MTKNSTIYKGDFLTCNEMAWPMLGAAEQLDQYFQDIAAAEPEWQDQPSAACISAILNYSKALCIKKTPGGLPLEVVFN